MSESDVVGVVVLCGLAIGVLLIVRLFADMVGEILRTSLAMVLYAAKWFVGFE